MATTTNFAWAKPTVDADVDTWGTILNTLFDDIDADVAAKTDPRITGTLTLGPVAATGSPKVEINSNTVSVAPPLAGDVHVISDNSGGGSRVSITGFTNAGTFIGRLSQGTAASPSAVLVSNYLCQLQGRGRLATGWSGSLARLGVIAEENYTDSTAKTGIGFETTPAGAVTSTEVVRISGAGALTLLSTTGWLALPSMTSTQRDALSSPPNGALIFNSTTGKIQGRESGAWANII